MTKKVFLWLTALLLLVVVVHLEHDVRVKVLSSDGEPSFLKVFRFKWALMYISNSVSNDG